MRVVSTLQYPLSSGESTRLNTIDVQRVADPVDTGFSRRLWVIMSVIDDPQGVPRYVMGRVNDRTYGSYLHGGAWRDPHTTSESFLKTSELILESEVVENWVAGFASINYRLSPYPSEPHAPSSLDDIARNVQHPEHLQDVLDALCFLQDMYHFGQDYVLVGHSAGATLAWQVVVSPGTIIDAERNARKPILPRTVIGVAGIYDLPSLVARHASQPIYEEIVRNAFGGDGNWIGASPLTWLVNPNNHLHEAWPNACLSMLVWSTKDELVEEEQSLDMWKALRQLQHCYDSDDQGDFRPRQDEKMVLLDQHDEIWKSGSGLASAIVHAIHRTIGLM